MSLYSARLGRKDYSPSKQIASFVILILLGTLACLRPVSFQQTIGLNWFFPISIFFWIFLAFGLLIPFLTRWIRNPWALSLWGMIVFSLYWGYFTLAEPQLRYQDSFVHSRTTVILENQGISPSLDQYLLWPFSFIFQSVFSNVSGLTILETSRILGFILVASIGLALMHFISIFLKPRAALLSLYTLFVMPNTLLITTQHYSPQLFAYFIAILVSILACGKAKKSAKLALTLTLFLVAIVFSNPTTTLWIAPILVGIWFFAELSKRHDRNLLTREAILLFIAIVFAWWFQPAGSSQTTETLEPSVQRIYSLFTTGRITLSEGLFRQSYQPSFSAIIRQGTFVFLGIIILPSIIRFCYRNIRALYNRTRMTDVDFFFSAVITGSLASTLILWIAASGGFGDRSWAILVPLLAIFFVESIIGLNRRKRTKIIAKLLTLGILILVPLNFVAVNYNETLYQTSISELAGMNFVASQAFQNQYVFSDSEYILLRFSYAMPDPSNVFFTQASHTLDPETATNETYLAGLTYNWLPHVQWTIFIHADKASMLLYARYGRTGGSWEGFNSSSIDKVYDNGEIQIYGQFP